MAAEDSDSAGGLVEPYFLSVVFSSGQALEYQWFNFCQEAASRMAAALPQE
jgi:hypothetical protein